MSTKIKHEFFELAGKAFIDYLDQMFKPFSDNIGSTFPIMITNTGDEIFLHNMFNDVVDNEKPLYSSIPRMSLDVRGIGIQSEQLTNYHDVLANATVQDSAGFNKRVKLPVRRIPVTWTFNTEVVFNNIFEFLTFTEIFLTVSHHNHTFSFFYAGSEYHCMFLIPTDVETNVSLNLAYDTSKRERRLPLNFMLELQYPAFDIYPVGNHKGHDGFAPNETMQSIEHTTKVESISSKQIINKPEN